MELTKKQCEDWLKEKTKGLGELGLRVKIVDGEQYSEGIIARKMFEMDKGKDADFLFVIERDRMLDRESYQLTMLFCRKDEFLGEIDF